MSNLATTIRLEADALINAIGPVSRTYDDALPHLACRSPVLFSGMGKSGIVAQKAASTFRSLGVPAHYVHPGDASHGDLGCVTGDAVMVLLSNSGDTPELADIMFFCRDRKVPIVAITGNPHSALAEAATVALCYGKVREACPNGLAPTTSTTVAMALCDALAVDVAHYLKISPADFKRFHPGGKLGVRLKTVRDVMRTPVPQVHPTAGFKEVVVHMTGNTPGIVLVANKSGTTLGVITDGDLRRALDVTPVQQIGKLIANGIMTKDFLSVPGDMRVEDVTAYMTRNRITKVLVRAVDAGDAGLVIGVVNLHDAMKGL